MSKIILDLCGGTGAWSRPYREAGYDVRLITLPQYNVLRASCDRYGVEFKRMGIRYLEYMTVLYKDVYGILAAPPCTEFSLAKGNRPRNFPEAMCIVRSCMDIIWYCRTYGNLKFWAMENPVGFLRQFMGIPHYTFKQWEFGESTVKRTDIWGYFNKPTPTVKEPPEQITTHFGKIGHAQQWSKPKVPEEYAEYLSQFGSGDRRAAVRAITPKGFADAFYRANK